MAKISIFKAILKFNSGRHFFRVTCLIITLYMIGCEWRCSFDAYACWSKLIREDCFYSARLDVFRLNKRPISEGQNLLVQKNKTYGENVSRAIIRKK